MQKIIFRYLLSFLILVNMAWATMSLESQKLEQLRLEAESRHDCVAEMAYLKAFPRSYARFHFIFYGYEKTNGKCCGELYPHHNEHLNLLWKLAREYPSIVLGIQLSIAVNGRWDADAVGILQKQLTEQVSLQTKEFVEAMAAYPRQKRLSIIAFLADIENHIGYTPYQNAIDSLQKLNYKKLTADFIRAREERQKWHYD